VPSTPAQVPALGIFEKSMEMGKFDKSRALSDGSQLTFKKARPQNKHTAVADHTLSLSSVLWRNA
jgi:hypothetical protein